MLKIASQHWICKSHSAYTSCTSRRRYCPLYQPEKCISCQAYVQEKLLSSTFVSGFITQMTCTFSFLPIK